MEPREIFLSERCKCSGAVTCRRRFLFGATATRESGIPPLARVCWLLAVCGLLVALSAPSARACIEVGGCDGFGVGGAPPTVQVPDFAAWIQQNATVYCDGGVPRPFDTVNDIDCFFGYSLEGLSNLCCPANLLITLKAGTSQPDTDALRLVYQGGTGPPPITPRQFAWNISLNALDESPLCTHASGVPNDPDGTWSANEEMTCVFDLCDLPPDADGTSNLQTDIRARGALDVFVEDDTGVDCIALCNNICCIDPPSGMVAWWTLDEMAGPTAIDSAGNNDGTHVNGPAPLAGQYVDNSLCFDGDDYVEVPNDDSLDFGDGDFSIDAWVKRDPGSTNSPPSVIVDKRDSEGIGYALSVSYGRLVLTMSGTNYITNASPVPADGLWHFVAVTVNRATNVVQFYSDCSPLNTFIPLPGDLDNANSLRIGAGSVAGINQPWLGCIDELELFNRALTLQEIQSICNAGSTGKCKEACCFPDDTCEMLDPLYCVEQGGEPQGDESVCLGTEACCDPLSQVCYMADALCCNGTPQGPGTACTAEEACCWGGGTCDMVVPACCDDSGGDPQGAGTVCTALEACCFSDDTSQMLDPLCCIDRGGVPQGPGSVWLGMEACCDAETGVCYVADALCCLANGDTPQGSGTVCTAPEACCFFDDTCEMLDPLCCEDRDGVPQGPGSVCPGEQACCFNETCEMRVPPCFDDPPCAFQGPDSFCRGTGPCCHMYTGDCFMADLTCCLWLGHSLAWVDVPFCEEGICCGDGIRWPAYEECDDGNTEDGDGCSSSCTVEIGPPLPPDPPYDFRKNRYIAFNSNNTDPIVIQVQVAQLVCDVSGDACSYDADCPDFATGERCLTPSGFDPVSSEADPEWETIGWLGEPCTITPGTHVPADTWHTMVVSDMPTLPGFEYTDPAAGDPLSTVFVGDCEIMPRFSYGVRATVNGNTFTERLVIGTILEPVKNAKKWADVVGHRDAGTGEYTEPNQRINVDDVQVMIVFLNNKSYRPHVTVLDLSHEVPDYKISADDFQMVLRAFNITEDYPPLKFIVEASGAAHPRECPPDAADVVHPKCE